MASLLLRQTGNQKLPQTAIVQYRIIQHNGLLRDVNDQLIDDDQCQSVSQSSQMLRICELPKRTGEEDYLQGPREGTHFEYDNLGGFCVLPTIPITKTILEHIKVYLKRLTDRKRADFRIGSS